MKHKAITRAVGLLLTLVMVLGLLPVSALPAFAAEKVGAHSFTNGSGEVFLGGEYIELGLAKSGSFGTSSAANSSFHPVGGENSDGGQLGMARNNNGFASGTASNTGDFFLPGSPEERYIVAYEVDGNRVSNNNSERMLQQYLNYGYTIDRLKEDGEYERFAWVNPKQAPATVNESSGNTLQATTTGVTKDNLKMAATVSFQAEQQFYQTTVTLTNQSAKTLKDVRYVRSFDPDQDLDLNGTYATYNKVICNPNTPYDASGKNYKVGTEQVAMVVARGSVTKEPFFFVAFDTRARASRGISFAPGSAWQEREEWTSTDGWDTLWATNGSGATTYTDEVIDNIDGYTNEDNAIAITFACGDLAPGASTTFTFYSSLAPASKLEEVIKTIERSVGGSVYNVFQNVDGTWPETAPATASGSFGETFTPSAQAHFTAKYYTTNEYARDGQKAITGNQITDLTADDSALYVYYERDKFTVTLYKDSLGKTVDSTKSVYYGQKLSSVLTDSTMPGTIPNQYTFEGWAMTPPQKDNSYKGQEYVYKELYGDADDGLTAKRLNPARVTVTGNISVYPMFIRNRIAVHLDVGAKDANATETILNGWSGNGSNAEPAVSMDPAQYRSFYTDMGEKVNMTTMSTATREGYELFGWVTKDGTTWHSESGTGLSYVDDAAETARNAERHFNYYTMTLTAQWKPTGETKAYEPYPETAPETAPTITYHLNGGKVGGEESIDPVTVGSNAAVTLPTVTKDGYELAGWRTADNAVVATKEDTTIAAPGEDLELYAMWTAGGYTIKLTTVAGSGQFEGGNDSEEFTVYPGTMIVMLDTPIPVDDQHIFIGWKNGENEVPLPFTMGANDLVLTAQWLTKETPPTGTVGVEIDSKTPTVIHVTSPAPVSPETFEYSVDGVNWSTNPDINVNPHAADPITVYVRKAASDDTKAPSDPIEGSVGSEDKAEQAAPEAPSILETEDNIPQINPANSALEYSLDGETYYPIPKRVIQLGTSPYYVMVPNGNDDGYWETEPTSEEIANGLVGYYCMAEYDPLKDMDFDVYQFHRNDTDYDDYNTSDDKSLEAYAKLEASEGYDLSEDEVFKETINGIDVWYYDAVDTADVVIDNDEVEKGFRTRTYIFETEGDPGDYIELVFWLESADDYESTSDVAKAAEAAMEEIVETLTRERPVEVFTFDPEELSDDYTIYTRARATGTQKPSEPVTFKKLSGVEIIAPDTIEVGNELTAKLSPEGAEPVTYSWYRVDKDGKETRLMDGVSADGKKYTAQFDDMGYSILVRVSQPMADKPVTVEARTASEVSTWEANTKPEIEKFEILSTPSTPDKNGAIAYTGENPAAEMLEYSVDGGKTWHDFGTSPLSTPAGEYYFRTKGSIENKKGPSEPVGSVKLLAQHDLIELRIESDSEGLSITEGNKLTAVTNSDLDGIENTTITSKWYRVDRERLTAEDRFDGNKDTARTLVGTGNEYTVTEEDVGYIIVLETTWTSGTTYRKTLSTPTPIIVSKSEADAEKETAKKISGQILISGNGAADAIVELRQGDTTLAAVTSNASGEYSFDTVRPGTYNIVVTYGGKTQTETVTVADEDVTGKDISMLDKDASYQLIVSGDAPAVTVDGLREVADAQDVEAGSSVHIVMEVSNMASLTETDDAVLSIAQRAQKKDQQMIAALSTGANRKLEFFDFSLNKLVTKDNKTTTERVSETDELIAIRIPFPGIEKMSSIAVYRVHDASVDVITARRGENAERIVVGNNVITVYAKNFSTYAIGYSTKTASGSTVTPKFSVNIEQPKNAKVTADPKTATPGEKVTLTVTPDEGFEAEAVTVVDSNGNPVTVTKNEDGTYSFVMPSSAVKVSVAVKNADEEIFKDVKKTDWYHDAVYHCYKNGFFKGISKDEFAPNGVMTRSMFATVLYRIAKEPAADSQNVFTDVKNNTWYSNAVIWGSGKGIILGYGNGLFGTDDSVTREQIVALFWRYLNEPEAKENADLSRYSDADSISGYAKDAVMWAVGSGIINGSPDGHLNPQAPATRAEVAQIVYNFDRFVAESSKG